MSFSLYCFARHKSNNMATVTDQGSVSSGSEPEASSQGASSTGDATSSPSTQTAKDPEKCVSLAGNETRRIRLSRAVFLVFLVVLAAIAGLATYFAVSENQHNNFQNSVRGPMYC